MLRVPAKACIGEPAPDIILTDPADGRIVRLSDYRGRDMMLVFFRGTWCPYCRDQMRLLAENHDRLTRAGITLLGAVCQARASVLEYLDANPLPFPLLLDESRDAAKAMGTHYWLRYEGFNLSQPALFVLDRDGIVTLAHMGRNMRDLPVVTVIEKFLGFLES
jgi:peroxiredoxin